MDRSSSAPACACAPETNTRLRAAVDGRPARLTLAASRWRCFMFLAYGAAFGHDLEREPSS
ncbi:MAG TPA: hypothetical protein VN894_09695 [Polyangiaceae bacterium]|nr:hypothetical protein [Polyangiaceae bacterium]